jgi:hypothetical protein
MKTSKQKTTMNLKQQKILPEVPLHTIIPNTPDSMVPADLELTNGTSHRIWFDIDSLQVVRVEGETITVAQAQAIVSSYGQSV